MYLEDMFAMASTRPCAAQTLHLTLMRVLSISSLSAVAALVRSLPATFSALIRPMHTGFWYWKQGHSCFPSMFRICRRRWTQTWSGASPGTLIALKSLTRDFPAWLSAWADDLCSGEDGRPI